MPSTNPSLPICRDMYRFYPNHSSFTLIQVVQKNLVSLFLHFVVHIGHVVPSSQSAISSGRVAAGVICALFSLAV